MMDVTPFARDSMRLMFLEKLMLVDQEKSRVSMFRVFNMISMPLLDTLPTLVTTAAKPEEVGSV